MTENMKIAAILGTRPEIIKMSPIIAELQKRSADFFILHTGQHYSYEMDKSFFDDLELPESKYNINAGGLEYRKQIGFMARKISEILRSEKPDVVLAQGDTNSVLAGAMAAAKAGTKIGHVEAGLRSHDLRMAEETNRILTDHISDYLFAPTRISVDYLIEEGIDKDKIFLTGNTIVDAVNRNLKLAGKKSEILNNLNLRPGGYILATAHRAENVDDRKSLDEILRGLKMIAENFNTPVIFPMHPRTKNKIAEFSLAVSDKIAVMGPLGYLDFLRLEAGAKLIITDSGGLQEEACILRIPCVTARENTERPETVAAGANMLAGADAGKMLQCARIMAGKNISWTNPFGDGKAAEKIINCFKI